MCCAVVALAFPIIGTAQESAKPNASYDRDVAKAMVAKGVAYFRSVQADDGSFSKELGPGITGLVVSSMLRNGVSRDDETVKKGMDYVSKFIRKEDGGIYSEGSVYRNYETCISLMMFAEANSDGKYDSVIQNAKKFIKKIQWGEDAKQESLDFGGAGYGKHGRPDLSNTSFLIDALKSSMDEGDKTDRAALERALKFVSRTQNKYSQDNMTEFARKATGEDVGGFYYTPANGGESKAGKTANGGLRSYASMTYAGLKSLLYAGVKKDDPRVKAATEWISKHYDLKSNPGVGQQGLFYYYHIFAKALSALGVDEIVDGDGKKHNWRSELLAELKTRQRKDGSWLNPKSSRWEEGNPHLVTAYCLLAISHMDAAKATKKK